MSAHSLRILGLASLVTVTAAWTSCDGPLPIDLEFEDRDRFTPSGRVAYEILPGNDTRRRGSLLDLTADRAPLEGAEPDGEPRRTAEPIVTLVGEIASVDGRGDVAVPSGREAELDVVIPGPAVVRTTVKNLRGHVGVRAGVRLADAFSFEGLVGVGVDDTRVRVRSGALTGQDHDLKAGFLSGARVTLRPIPLFDLYGQATVMIGRAVTTDIEAGAQLNLTPNVGLYGGYRRWNYEEESLESGGSDGDFEFAGPTLGISLTF